MVKGSAKLIRITESREPGSVSDFRRIRGGTDRAAVLKLMNGTMSPEQIAKKLGGEKFTARYVMAHVYCLRRDCGIGYELNDRGKLVALYPGDKTYRDTVKKLRSAPPPAEPAHV